MYLFTIYILSKPEFFKLYKPKYNKSTLSLEYKTEKLKQLKSRIMKICFEKGRVAPTGHALYFKYINFVALIFNLVGNLFIAEYGIMAAAISTLVAYITILVGQMTYMKILRAKCV
jgi:hypothetical protein